MPRPALAIFGYSQAAMFLARSPWPDVTAVISIHGPREFGVETRELPSLDLHFEGVEVAAPEGYPVARLRQRSRKRWTRKIGLTETPPTAADARAIMDFAGTLR